MPLSRRSFQNLPHLLESKIIAGIAYAPYQRQNLDHGRIFSVRVEGDASDVNMFHIQNGRPKGIWSVRLCVGEPVYSHTHVLLGHFVLWKIPIVGLSPERVQYSLITGKVLRSLT